MRVPRNVIVKIKYVHLPFLDDVYMHKREQRQYGYVTPNECKIIMDFYVP